MATATRIDGPFQAACFLYDRAAHAVLLHKRDGNTSVNPHKWAFFGGRALAGETDVDCCLRELREEIGLHVTAGDLVRLRSYWNEEHALHRVVFYVEKAVPLEDLVLGEGAGMAWVELAQVMALDLTGPTRADIGHFMERALPHRGETPRSP